MIFVSILRMMKAARFSDLSHFSIPKAKVAAMLKIMRVFVCGRAVWFSCIDDEWPAMKARLEGMMAR